MKFGLIGAGGIDAIRAAALARSKSCSLTAVHDVDEARARSVAPSARFHASSEALIDSADVEAVIISTPPQFHEPLAVAAAKAGKHALVEKPMAATPDACERMIDAARGRYFPQRRLQSTLFSRAEGRPRLRSVWRNRPPQPRSCLCGPRRPRRIQGAVDVRC